MADLTTLPLQDNYKSTLSQSWNGAVGTIYVNTAPSFTFPAGKKCYIVVNPEKSNMQVARISAYDATLKTITVDSITVDKGNGVAYTQQSHAVGSKVMISDSYQFREDLATAIDSKVDTNSDDTATGKFADATARDAYFTSPVNGNSAYLTTEGKRTDYVGGAWVDRATGSTPNASTTVAGKVEKATSGEVTAGTATGGTGAELFVGPAELKTVTDGLTTSINAKPSIASNATASAGSNTTDAINALQLKNYYGPAPIAGTVFTAVTSAGGVSTSSTTYVKKLDTTGVYRAGTYTVNVSISNNSGTGYVRIYKNGSAVGTERTITGSTTGSRAESITFADGDIVQVYMKHSTGGDNVSLTGFSMQYSAYPMTATTY